MTLLESESKLHTFTLRLKPGEDLRQKLEELARERKIAAGIILTCVGSLCRLIVRPAGRTEPLSVEENFEVVSLVGTLSPGGNHLHISASDSLGVTLGGHLLEGCTVRTTAEITVGILENLRFERDPDPTTGYNELAIHPI